MTNKTKLILTAAGSMAAGALLGILFAPKSGKETRKQIADSSKDYADDLLNRIKSGIKAARENHYETNGQLVKES